MILWQVLPTLGLVNQIFIPTPTTILVEMWSLILDGTLQADLIISLYRVVMGFIIALLVGLSLGFLLGGFFKKFEKALNPLIQVLSQANPFTLFPVFIIFLGIGEISKILIIYWVSQWSIMTNTITGINNVDPIFIKLGKAIGLGKIDIFRKIIVPASLPTVFTGIRMGAVFSFFMLIGAEMMGTTSGLGYMIMQAQNVMQIPRMWVGIVVVALLGLLTNYLILWIEKQLVKGKEKISI
ncbi:MAG: ABC transporter permease [Methanobrevibacter sp.]|nr:ABC transporter permease [Methanobrevibacter sp.]